MRDLGTFVSYGLWFWVFCQEVDRDDEYEMVGMRGGVARGEAWAVEMKIR